METPFFTKCLFEFIGTLVLILMGDGVVANNTLKGTKGNNGGWIVITIAWGLAVMCGVLIAGPYSGAHLSPAVTVGFAVAGTFPWSQVLGSAVQAYTKELYIHNQVLYVKVTSSVLRHELFMNRKSLVHRLNTHVKAQVITDIIFR